MSADMVLTTTDSESGGLPDYCRVIKINGPNGQVKEMIFPKALDLDRPKRPRTTFSTEQLSTLEREFRANQYLIGSDRKRLAEQLALTETQIKVWFQNRRTKCKRERGDSTTDGGSSSDQQRLSSSPVSAGGDDGAASSVTETSCYPPPPVPMSLAAAYSTSPSAAYFAQSLFAGGRYVAAHQSPQFGVVPMGTSASAFGFVEPFKG